MAGVKLACLSCGQGNRVPREKLGQGPKCGTCGAKLVEGKPVEVSPDVLDKAIRIDGLPLVVDFWAPWCGPCRMMAPAYAEAAALLVDRARLVKLNTEEWGEAGARHNIRSIPTIALFTGGRERVRHSGALPAAGIVDWVEKAAAAPA